MESREVILSKIKEGQRLTSPAPEYISGNSDSLHNLQELFEQQLKANSVEVYRTYSLAEHESILNTCLSPYKLVHSSVPGYASTVAIQSTFTASDLKDLEACAICGTICVAENGAILIPEVSLSHRALPFIVPHLLVWVVKQNIVATMHEAYEKADKETGYSVFIAGPSKTADIEQSLVIGAHGPKQMTVIIKSCDNVL